MINKIFTTMLCAAAVSAVALEVKLNLPTLNLGVAPVVSVGTVSVESSGVESPAVGTVSVESSGVESPAVGTVSVESSGVESPAVGTVSVESSGVESPSVESSDPGVALEVQTVQTPAIEKGDNRIAAVQAFHKKLQQIFRDKRNIKWDMTALYDSRSWEKWIKLYEENKPYVIEYKALPKGLRIISEVKCPQGASDWTTLEKNLAYYQKAGYNAVLLSFTLQDNLSDLLKLVNFLKGKNWKIIFAFSGAERLEETAFPDPDELGRYLAALGVSCDALLLGWRRTSLHLLTPDQQYINHLVRSARSANADLPVIGMAYFGATSESNHKLVSSYSIPEGVSAVLMVNIGYPFKDMKKVIEQRFPKIKDLPKIGQALGPWPYYDSRFNMKKSFEEIQKIKRNIEQKFLQAGCIGTLTLRGDGSDGLYNPKVMQNLCKQYLPTK